MDFNKFWAELIVYAKFEGVELVSLDKRKIFITTKLIKLKNETSMAKIGTQLVPTRREKDD